MDRILAASIALPTWTRWSSWLATAATVFLATAFPSRLWLPLALLLGAFTAFSNLPVVAFDGPLPFSSLGVHARGEVFTWDQVVRVEPGERHNLQAIVIHQGQEHPVPLRVRGAHTWDEFRSALAAHAPDKVAF